MKLLKLCLTVSFALTCCAANAEMVVVMSNKSPALGLTSDHISQIFLAKANTFLLGQVLYLLIHLMVH